MILIASILKAGKNYYPQIFLQECNIIKEKSISNYIIGDVENSDKEDSSEEDSDKKDSSEEN